MNEDAELLRRYASEHSESAFTELIRRHVNLVYSAALRVAGEDIHRAEREQSEGNVSPRDSVHDFIDGAVASRGHNFFITFRGRMARHHFRFACA